MELVKNIFFNTDKIVENSKLKISYVGTLYQNGAEDVYLHYGFGLNWENVSEAQMNKTELGFQCEIDVLEYESLNLCFRSGTDEWDNNDGENYIFEIEKEPLPETDDTCEEEEDTCDTETTSEETSLTVTGDNGMQVHKGLRKTYIWSKKVRLAVYKIIKFFPKIISGNYKRKISEEE